MSSPRGHKALPRKHLRYDDTRPISGREIRCGKLDHGACSHKSFQSTAKAIREVVWFTVILRVKKEKIVEPLS